MSLEARQNFSPGSRRENGGIRRAKESPGREAAAHRAQGVGTYPVHGGVANGCRCHQVGALGALGIQQGKEAQDSKSPKQCHAETRRHLQPSKLVAGRRQ